MSLATKTLSKQKHRYFSRAWQGLLLMAIGIFGGIMILKNGIGNPPASKRGPAAWLYEKLSSLMQASPTGEKLVPICFAGFFFILAAIGLYHLICGIRCMKSSNTLLGKSILHQAKNYESFSDIMDSINADMDMSPSSFGKVYIGREWILEAEAMRLSGIQGAFWENVGQEDYVLFCVDEAKNIWGSSFRYEDDRDNAAKYLQKRLPDIIVGDKEAYIAFINVEK